MSPQDTSWISGLLGGGITLLFVLLGNLVKRFDPDVKAKTEDALWAKVQKQLEESDERERKLEERVSFLERARDEDRKEHERQRAEDRQRISDLETQVKDKDKKIAELTRQIQGKRKGML